MPISKEAQDIRSAIYDLQDQRCQFSPNKVLDILRQHKIIKLVSFQEFVNHFRDACKEQNEKIAKKIIRNMRKEYKKCLSNQVITNRNCFPMIIDNSKQIGSNGSRQEMSAFEKIRWGWFLEEEARLMNKQVKSKRISLPIPANAGYQIDLQGNFTMKPSENQIQASSKANNIDPPDVNNDPSVQQQSQEQSQESFSINDEELNEINAANTEIQKYPQFLLYDQEWQEKISIKRLLSLNVTHAFSSELAQVKKLISSQIEQNGSYLLTKFTTFASNYFIFKEFTSGAHQLGIDTDGIDIKTFLKNYKEKYLSDSYPKIHYLQGLNSSPIYDYWLKLKQRLEEEEEKKPDEDQVRQKILQCLNNIELFYTPYYQDDPYFGESRTDSMLINLNHNKDRINLSIFWSGPLKPYLYLIILHEIAHMLLRKLSLFKQDTDQSLDLKSDAIGSMIYDQFFKMGPYIERIFQKNYIDTSRHECYEKNVIIMKQKLKQKLQNVRKYQALFNHIKIQVNAIAKAKLIINSIDIMFESIKETKIIDKKWLDLIDIIEQNAGSQKPQASHLQEQNDQNQQCKQRQFVAAVFLSAKYLTFSQILKGKKYLKSVQLLLAQQSKGFTQEVGKALQIIFYPLSRIYRQLKQLNLLESFISTFFQEQPDQQLRKALEAVNENFKNEELYFFDENSSNAKLGQGSQRIIVREILKKSVKIFEIFTYYNDSMILLKRSEFLLIACELPNFFFTHKIKAQNDSGFYFERMLFPKLESSGTIYQKDYQFIKQLSKETENDIGETPIDAEQARRCIRVRRASQGNSSKNCIRLRPRKCRHESYWWLKPYQKSSKRRKQ